MLKATFEQAYPIALRAAQVRATAAVVSGAVPMADRQDLEQEGLTACWRALPRFDPARASLRTFVEHVIAARLASVIRAARRAPTHVPIKSAAMQAVDFDAAEIETRADIHRVQAALGAAERQLISLLREHSPAEVSRILGLPRSTVHDRIVRIRRRFVTAGVGRNDHSRNGGVR